MPARTSSSSKRTLVFSLCLLLSCLAPAGVAARQTNSGTLFGRVRDRAGRGVGGVRVQIVNEETGNPRARVTNDEGYFTIENLRAGNYSINAAKDGYFPQSYRRFPVQITIKNEVKVPDITLRQAAVEGRVVDRAGNALGGAKVVVAALSARVSASTATDERGVYRIEDLPPGPYIITATWSGPHDVEDGHGLTSELLSLEREETAAPTLRLAEVLRASARQTGATPSAVQTTEGTRAASLVHTVDVARVSNFSGRLFASLPIGGSTLMRSFDEFALLAPGVAPPPYTPGARGPGVGYGVGTAGQFSVNGMRARSNNFSVDGSDNNDPDVGVRRQGFVALVPQSIESVKDFSIATLLWDAELGRNFGAQVNAVSDYGGNALHGQLYGLFTDSSLNARNFFDLAGGPSLGEDPFTRTQLGFTFGGPIRRDRTHFFISYERQQTSASSEQHFATPTAGERRFNNGQNFGAGDLASTTIFGPFQNTTPLGRNVLSLYPLPNNPAGPYGANTYTQVLPADGRGDIFSAKLSQQAWSGGLFSARYNFTDDRRTLPAVNRAIRSTLDSATRSHNLSLVLDSPLGPRFFNEARFSFGRTALRFDEYPGSPFVFSASSTQSVPLYNGSPISVTSQTGLLGELLIEPFSPVGVNVETFPQRRASNTFQFADTVSRSLGGHSLKFGANVRRYQLNSVLDRFYRPQAVYAGGLTSFRGTTPQVISGVQLASIGVASSVMQTITAGPPDSTVGLRFNEYHLFANDNWRIRPRFALDLGLRYEYSTVPREVNNRIEDALRLDQLPRAGASRFDTAARTAAFNEAVEAYRRVLDGRTRIYEPDRNDLGGHAGFAWSLDSAGRTVLRGGFGVYYDTTLGAVVSQSRNVFPNEIPLNVDPSFLNFSIFTLNNPAFLVLNRDANNNQTAPGRLVRTGACNQFGTCNQFGGGAEDFAALVGQLFIQNTTGGLAYTLPRKQMPTPYAQQWHLTLEREFSDDYYLSAAYVGTRGTKLTQLLTPNLGPYVTPIIPLVDIMLPGVTSVPDPNGFPIIVSNSVRSGASFIADPFGNVDFMCPPQSPTEPQNPTLPFICGSAFFSFNSRPNPALGAYRIFENSAASNYQALQVEARKRYSRGFQFTAAYTWSHAIDDVSDLFPIAGAPALPQNSFDLRAERASANFDVRHRFASSLVWDLPYGRDAKGLGRFLLSDWQVASLFQTHTGQPFTLNLPFDGNLDGNLSDRPSTTDGLIFFGGHGRERVRLAPGRGFADYINRTRVNAPNGQVLYVFLDGATGRNTARGDSFVNLDLSVAKRFNVTEGQSLLFRTEVFNALNRANFGLPVRVIGAPGFGSAVDTATPARTIQFVIKYQF